MINASPSTFIHKLQVYFGNGEMNMTENEIREPYEQPELTKLGSLRELTTETGEPCEDWTCMGSFGF